LVQYSLEKQGPITEKWQQDDLKQPTTDPPTCVQLF
jgi:hypothetical protein